MDFIRNLKLEQKQFELRLVAKNYEEIVNAINDFYIIHEMTYPDEIIDYYDFVKDCYRHGDTMSYEEVKRLLYNWRETTHAKWLALEYYKNELKMFVINGLKEIVNKIQNKINRIF